ncbi:MAG TPA: IS1595 family transposase [Acidobacteriaceae bacterium]
MNRRQTIPPQQKYTLKDFELEYPDDDACLEAILQWRWPEGKTLCVICGVERKHYRVSGRTSYACRACGNHIYPLAGTIFHKSTTSLRTWFYVMRLMTSTRVGVSAKHIQRETGVTYKTAWRMMKQIRMLMAESGKLIGPVEIDEAYFGAPDANKHSHLRGKGKAKTPVLGIVERRGRVITRVLPDATKDSILPVVGDVLHSRTMIYSDQSATLEQVRWMGQSHKHATVNHSERYVDGYAHTNTIDGFWSLVKRGIGGVYYQVGPEYLQSYLNEYSWRYNRRVPMRQPFQNLLAQLRLTLQP